jgi:DivIVA domain-containing protein
MEQDSIDRIRGATFPIARKGYDKREVERYLGRLADWLEHGGADESRSELVQRELERVGEKTGGILTAAEAAAEELRLEAEQEAEEIVGRARVESDAARSAAHRYDTETRSEADAYSERSRVEADTYSSETRADADAYGERTRKDAEIYAAETRERVAAEADEARAAAEAEARSAIADAQAEAKRIVEEANRNRADIEAVIADLEDRRDGVIAELQRLATEVSGTADQHRPSPEPDGGDGESTEHRSEPAKPKRASAGQRTAR